MLDWNRFDEVVAGQNRPPSGEHRDSDVDSRPVAHFQDASLVSPGLNSRLVVIGNLGNRTASLYASAKNPIGTARVSPCTVAAD